MPLNTTVINIPIKKTISAILSIIYATLFLTVSIEGGCNLKLILPNNTTTDNIIFALSIIGSIVVSAFTYRTLNALRLTALSSTSKVFSIMSIFSAISLFTASKNGSTALNIEADYALVIAMILTAIKCISGMGAAITVSKRHTLKISHR